MSWGALDADLDNRANENPGQGENLRNGFCDSWNAHITHQPRSLTSQLSLASLVNANATDPCLQPAREKVGKPNVLLTAAAAAKKQHPNHVLASEISVGRVKA